MSSIAVIDYGMGNLRSVAKALEHVASAGTRITVTADPKRVLASDRIVFPGQGAAGDCMRALRDQGLDEAVREAVTNKPFLGICMGMQVLVESSEENEGTRCIGIFPGKVKYFGDAFNVLHSNARLKIPHMGWNRVNRTRPHRLWAGISEAAYFYFVHSYYLEPKEACLTAGETDYGVLFTSVIARENVFAMQCHPEKSALAGLKLLANFTQWDGNP